MTRAPWTESQLDFLRANCRTMTAAQIAKAIGRSRRSVHNGIHHFGLSRGLKRTGPDFRPFIRERHALGWSDAEIVAEWNQTHAPAVNRRTVSVHRAAMGLAHNAYSQRRRDRVRAKTCEQLAAAGVPTLGALRVKVFRDRARAAGWPEDLRPRHVQILNVLWDRGPMTRMEIAEAIGARTDYAPKHRIRKILVSNDPEGSYLAHLMRRGLVVSLGRRVKGKGRGKSVYVYSLPLTIQRKAV